MSPKTTAPSGHSMMMRLAWIPVPLFLVSMLVLWAKDLDAPRESLALAFTLNIFFSMMVSIFIAHMFARSFIASGSSGMLFLGSGIVIWGCAGVAGSASGLAGGPPVAVHNLCVTLAAACHATGALLLRRSTPPLRDPSLWLWTAYATSLGAVAAITVLGLAGAIPLFFVPGQGPTPLRQGVLSLDIVLFILTAILLKMSDCPIHSAFRRWYIMALLLIAIGLFGVMIQPARGSVLCWVGRAAQMVSGIYMLVAAIAAVRETHAWEVPLQIALRKSEEQFRLLFDHSPDAVFLTNPATGAVYNANPAARAMFGFTNQEFHTVWPSLIDQDDGRMAKAMEERKRTGQARVELTCIRKSGQRFPAEVTSVIVPDDADRSFVIVRDITHQKRAEEALRESEENYRAVVENTTAIILRVDPNGVITFANSRALNFFGYAPEELIGNPAIGTIVPEKETTGRDLASMIDQIAAHPDDFRFNFNENLCKDGRRVWLEWTNSGIYDIQGKLRGFLSVGIDATERKRSEEALTQYAAELARSNKDLEAFAHVAGHDLQEPLRMVSSFLTLLQEKYERQLDCTAQEYIRFSVEGSRRMLDLINDLLDYSRINAGIPQRAPVSLPAVLDEVRLNLSVAIAQSGAVITADPLPTVLANKGQIGQLFQNLISNAIKFQPPNRRPEVHIGARREAGEWVFAVKDNGIGIAPDQKSRLFQIFQRLHHPDEFPGTGIGLAICLRIVERHGGRIWVESEPGNGSMFCFTIPSA